MRHFDYAHTSPVDWENQLNYLSQGGIYEVVVPLFWGNHETLPGAPDFSSRSRLKIEKLFHLAKQLSINLDVQLGFFDAERSFPVWSKNLPHQSLVPNWSASCRLGTWEFMRVPSFQNPDLKESFLNFSRQVLIIAELYQGEGGSVREVSLDGGLLFSEAVLFDESRICSHFETRYQSMDKLNKAFQTSFKHFNSVGTERGFKTLLDKRPWLASWEFKILREEICQGYVSEVQELIRQHGFGKKPRLPGADVTSNAIFLCDDTPLEVAPFGETFLPLAPQGHLNDQVIQAFQVNEFIKLELQKQKRSLQMMSRWEPDNKASQISVICTKYLSKSVAQKLVQAHERGSNIQFVFELPTWDENLCHLAWPSEGFYLGRGLSEFI